MPVRDKCFRLARVWLSEIDDVSDYQPTRALVAALDGKHAISIANGDHSLASKS